MPGASAARRATREEDDGEIDDRKKREYDEAIARRPHFD